MKKAKRWLQNESANYPDKKIAEWIAAPDIKDLPSPLSDKEKLNAEIIDYLKEK